VQLITICAAVKSKCAVQKGNMCTKKCRDAGKNEGLSADYLVILLDRQPRGFGFKIQKFGSRFLLHLHPLANSAMMSTPTAHCQWEDEMVRERTGHPSSRAESKKMKLLTLHTYGCPKASLRD